MNERIFYSEYFYQKGSKDTEVLEKNAREHPYSSLAAFMLLYHYKKIAHPGFETFARKTALLFNNANWLQFQLHDASVLNAEREFISSENPLEDTEVPIEPENETPLEISPMQNFAGDTVEAGEDTTLQTEFDEIVPETISENLSAENVQTGYEPKDSYEEASVTDSFQQDDFSANEVTINRRRNNVLGQLMKMYHRKIYNCKMNIKEVHEQVEVY